MRTIQKQRKTKAIKQKAFYYFSLGLNSNEIGKLLNVSPRTIQGYMWRDKWKQKQKTPQICYTVAQLYESGLTYNQIAQTLNISRTTVYNYLKKTRTFKQKGGVK